MAEEASLACHSAECMMVASHGAEFSRTIGQFIERGGIADCGFEYKVVSSIAAQSSGTTLLNILLGTKFGAGLDDYNQCHAMEGICMAFNAESKVIAFNCMVRDDFYGVKSETTFERKSAKFLLAVSDVLFVHVGSKDVGKIGAPYMSLLIYILDLTEGRRKKLRGQSSSITPLSTAELPFHKMRLVFIIDDIADRVADTSAEVLKVLLRNDVKNIWRSINKAEVAKGKCETDYFDIDIFPFPERALEEEKFLTAVNGLKAKFQSGGWFRPEHSRSVEVRSFSKHVLSVWDTVDRST